MALSHDELLKLKQPSKFKDISEKLFQQVYAELNGTFNNPEWGNDQHMHTTYKQMKFWFNKQYGNRWTKWEYAQFYDYFIKDFVSLLPELYYKQRALVEHTAEEIYASTKRTGVNINGNTRETAEDKFTSPTKEMSLEFANLSVRERTNFLEKARINSSQALINEVRGFLGNFQSHFITNADLINYLEGGGVFTEYTFLDFIKGAEIEVNGKKSTMYELLIAKAVGGGTGGTGGAGLDLDADVMISVNGTDTTKTLREWLESFASVKSPYEFKTYITKAQMDADTTLPPDGTIRMVFVSDIEPVAAERGIWVVEHNGGKSHILTLDVKITFKDNENGDKGLALTDVAIATDKVPFMTELEKMINGVPAKIGNQELVKVFHLKELYERQKEMVGDVITKGAYSDIDFTDLGRIYFVDDMITAGAEWKANQKGLVIVSSTGSVSTFRREEDRTNVPATGAGTGKQPAHYMHEDGGGTETAAQVLAKVDAEAHPNTLLFITNVVDSDKVSWDKTLMYESIPTTSKESPRTWLLHNQKHAVAGSNVQAFAKLIDSNDHLIASKTFTDNGITGYYSALYSDDNLTGGRQEEMAVGTRNFDTWIGATGGYKGERIKVLEIPAGVLSDPHIRINILAMTGYRVVNSKPSLQQMEIDMGDIFEQFYHPTDATKNKLVASGFLASELGLAKYSDVIIDTSVGSGTPTMIAPTKATNVYTLPQHMRLWFTKDQYGKVEIFFQDPDAYDPTGEDGLVFIPVEIRLEDAIANHPSVGKGITDAIGRQITNIGNQLVAIRNQIANLPADDLTWKTLKQDKLTTEVLTLHFDDGTTETISVIK